MTTEKIVRQLRMELHTEAADLIEQLQNRIGELQEPEGHREERVAAWLRDRGYTVAKVKDHKKEPLAGARGGLDGGERL